MGFDFGAFVGGFAEQVSENIESEKTFQREKDFKLEMLAEEEATKARLLKSAERKKKNEVIEEVTENLAIHIGADNAAAFVKTYGIGGSNAFLDRAKDYDGDISTALELPEITNGQFGSDLVAPPTLSTILPAKKVEPTIDTLFKYTKNMSEELTTINAMADGKEKDDAMAQWEATMQSHETVAKRFADAARKEGTDKTKEGEFYSIDQRQELFKGFSKNAFEAVTDFVGERELYKEEITGSNTVAFVDAFAMIQAQEFNTKVFNDVNFTKEATANFINANNLLYEHGLGVLTPIAVEALSSGGLNKEIIAKASEGENKTILRQPDGYLNMDKFEEQAQKGTLKRRGVYVVKDPEDQSLKVITYLGIVNIFDEKKRNYLEHHAYDLSGSMDIFNKIEFE